MQIRAIRAAEVMKANTVAMLKKRLERKHAALEDLIGEETRRVAPDTLKLQKLKRRRLRVKERLSHLEGVVRTLASRPVQRREFQT